MSELSISNDSFGQTKDGTPIERYILQNASKLKVEILTFGATVHRLYAPDQNGQVTDIATGYDTVQGYEEGDAYFGAIIGRVANRIKDGKFSLDGEEFTLTRNNGPNALHGGVVGFNKKVWGAAVEGGAVRLTYTSPDGEEGYPGQLDVTVTYHLTADSQLLIDMTATTSKPTPINLTNHVYLNLSGHSHGDIYDQVITIPSENFTPKDEHGIPRGEFAPVAGSVFDLRTGVAFGKHIRKVPGDLGYDHTFCLPGKGDYKFAARVTDASTGRVVTYLTSAPGVHLYTGNYFGFPGKDGAQYNKHAAFSLEPQNFPDAINQPNFPSAVLRPGEVYRHSTSIQFSTAV